MATLSIKVSPSGGLRRYTLSVDGRLVRMHADNTGTARPNGSCGDGTAHKLGYALVGPAGAKLDFTISCDDGSSIGVPSVEIYPEGEPLGGGIIEFTL